MTPTSKFTCPYCGCPLRFEEWAATKQQMIEAFRKVRQSRGCKYSIAESILNRFLWHYQDYNIKTSTVGYRTVTAGETPTTTTPTRMTITHTLTRTAAQPMTTTRREAKIYMTIKNN